MLQFLAIVEPSEAALHDVSTAQSDTAGNAALMQAIIALKLNYESTVSRRPALTRIETSFAARPHELVE